MQIPLHCLVLCANRVHGECFASHERLSLASVTHDLIGQRQIDMYRIAFLELRHRIELKLSLGERVVIFSNDLTTESKGQLIDIAIAQGAYVIGIGERIRDLPYHDGTAIEPIAAFSTIDQKKYSGLTIIGDVHGDIDRLRMALEWAQSRRHYAWLLGDIIDYGSESLACAELVYHAVMYGRAGLILGNHERKIARWLDQRHARLSDGNKVTTEAINRLKASERRQWVGRFRSLLAHASLLYQVEHVTLIHAAAHPTLWARHPDNKLIEQYGLYGQGEMNGTFHRVHHWVDMIPKGKLVFVGHDVMASLPIVVTGSKGGQVVFLDTGCGKGGALSTADLRFSDTGIRLECFNNHGKCP